MPETASPVALQTQLIACAVCGGTQTHRCFSGPNPYCELPREFTVVRCLRCGLTFINPQPVWSSEYRSVRHTGERVPPSVRIIPPADLKRANQRLGHSRHPVYRAVLQRFKGYPRREPLAWWAWGLAPLFTRWVSPDVPPYRGHGRMLDIGCGSGLFLYMMKGLGWSVQGVEVKRELCDAADSIGVPVHCGTLEEAPFATGSFDLVRISHVFEHLHNPLEVLRRIRRLLGPQGLAVIEVPNVRSAHFHLFGPLWYGFPGHLYGFDPRTLTALGERAGLMRVAIRYKSSKGSFTACLDQWGRAGQTWPYHVARRLARSRWFRLLALGPFCQVLAWCRYGDIMQVWFQPSAAPRDSEVPFSLER